MAARSIVLTYEVLEDLWSAGGRLFVYDYNRGDFRKSPTTPTAVRAWRELTKKYGDDALTVRESTGDILVYGRKTMYRLDVP